MPTTEITPWEREGFFPQQWLDDQARQVTCQQPNNGTNNGLDAEIHHAQNLLTLGADWDGEGSEIYSKDTLDRAMSFLRNQSESVYNACGLYPPAPTIGPGPNGSIDLHWKTLTMELLINIPADVSQLAAYYGDDYGATKIKGSTDTKLFSFEIASWLMK